MEYEFQLFDVQSWKRHLAYGRVYHYLWAIVFVLFVFWCKVNLDEFIGTSTPFLLCSFAVFLATYIGGLGPGILSLALSAVLVYYIFLTPVVERYAYLPTIAFIVESFIIVYLVTRQRRMLFQKMELDLQKDDFISASSHELNTPLTSMKIYLDTLQHHVKRNHHHQYEESLSMLSSQTERLIRLVRSLLDITRLKANKVVFKHEKVEVMKCIQVIVKEIQNSSPLHYVSIEGKTTKIISGDEDRICQVISNLLTNAIKYSPRGGDVVVRVQDKDDYVEVAVKDSGIGIDKSKHKKIFDRFYRVAHANESTFSGLGIGLYLSSEIVKKHGGKIWVESEKGVGSTFFFTLPVMNEK
jgi:signal transduction histidine kinase